MNTGITTGFETDAEDLLEAFYGESEDHVFRFLERPEGDRHAILATLAAMLSDALCLHPDQIWPNETGFKLFADVAKRLLEAVYFCNRDFIRTYFMLPPDARGAIAEAIAQACYRETLVYSC